VPASSCPEILLIGWKKWLKHNVNGCEESGGNEKWLKSCVEAKWLD